MSDNKTKNDNKDFDQLLEKDLINVPKMGEIVKGTILSASKAEVRLDIGGIFTGIVRGQELYEGVDEYSNLKPGDEIEATVIEEDNENGELELSFRYAGHKKAWANLKDAFENKKVLKVKITGANRGGLVVGLGQISGFLPVSQLSPEKYPRVSGGDKTKILDKLKTYIGEEFDVAVANLGEEGKEDKIIFSEKDVWNEKQKDIINKYKVGTMVEGVITAIANFGVFVSFGDNLEGLIHISELAWQRIDDPGELYKVGDKIKAEIIGIDGSKIFLSAKKLLKDPWKDVEKKFKIDQAVLGEIIKVNPFGLFVKLDNDIHGLAHISQIGLAQGEKINEIYKSGEKINFTIVSIEPKDHRLGLAVKKEKKSGKKDEKAPKVKPMKEKETDGKETKEKKKDEKNEKAEKGEKTEKKAKKEKKKE